MANTTQTESENVIHVKTLVEQMLDDVVNDGDTLVYIGTDEDGELGTIGGSFGLDDYRRQYVDNWNEEPTHVIMMSLEQARLVASKVMSPEGIGYKYLNDILNDNDW